MAKFDIADKLTSKSEGFYSNDKLDSGGETIWGIARNKNPQWAGWKVVDEYKKKGNFPYSMKTDPNLLRLRREFYIQNYWNKIRGDEINNQSIANYLYDISVNKGISRVIEFISHATGISTPTFSNEQLNYLNDEKNRIVS